MFALSLKNWTQFNNNGEKLVGEGGRERRRDRGEEERGKGILREKDETEGRTRKREKK